MGRFLRNRSIFVDFIMLTIGAAIAAFAVEEFLVPCTIMDGGVIGVGIIINNLTGISLSILTIVLNAPFLFIARKKLGKQFIIKSAYSMVCFSISAAIFEAFTDATSEALLAVAFGGVILGIGVGIVIKFGGCLDGTETVAILINRKTKFPVGTTVLIFNIVIYGTAGIIFGFDRAMYSLLTYFIASKVIDYVETGLEQAKAAMIITNDAEEISNLIYSRLGRTVTIMDGHGLVSGKKAVLYCVVSRFEVKELRNIIDSIDSSAFVAVSDVSEIIGNHMKSKHRINKLQHVKTSQKKAVKKQSLSH